MTEKIRVKIPGGWNATCVVIEMMNGETHTRKEKFNYYGRNTVTRAENEMKKRGLAGIVESVDKAPPLIYDVPVSVIMEHGEKIETNN